MTDKTNKNKTQVVDETYDYGRSGTHMKKCEICGMIFEELNDLSVLITTGPAQCPYCKEIIELKQELIDFWNKFTDTETSNPIENRNFIKNEPNAEDFTAFNTVSYTLDDYDMTFEVCGRTKRVNDFINRVQEARKYLYEVIEPHIRILESLYERKDLFWKYGGNLLYYVGNASIQFVVIRLKEYLGTTSKYSIYKFINIITNNKKSFFDNHHIVEVKKFKRSGDISKIEYPHFEIDNYLGKLNDVLKSYTRIINALSDYRDTQFAHIDELKYPDASSKELTFVNIKRVFNSLKIIYDGFCFSIAPDLFANWRYDHKLWFDYLNQLAEEHEKKNDKNQHN